MKRRRATPATDGPPRADIRAEGEKLLEALLEAEERIQWARTELTRYLANLASLDDDLAALEAFRKVFTR